MYELDETSIHNFLMKDVVCQQCYLVNIEFHHVLCIQLTTDRILY